MKLDEAGPYSHTEPSQTRPGRLLFPVVGILSGVAAFAALYFSWPLVTELPGYPASPIAAERSTPASPARAAAPPPVENLVPKSGDRQVTLSWDPPTGGLKGRYIVEAIPEQQNVSQIRRCVTRESSCAIAGLTTGDTYNVEVRHEDEQGVRSAPRTARMTPRPDVLASRASRLWLDADDPATISDLSAGASAGNPVPVSTWLDKSGNDNNAVQPEQNLRPTWSRFGDRFAMDFSGNQLMLFNGLPMPKGVEPSTVFAVVQQNDLDDLSCFRHILAWGSGRPGGARIIHKGCGTSLLFVETFGTHPEMTPVLTWPRGKMAVLSARITETRIEVRLNGAEYYSWTTSPEIKTDTFPQQDAMVGGAPWAPPSAGWLGRIGEVAVISENLNNTELRRVESYLIRKWGIS